MSVLRIDVVTIFPGIFPGPLAASIPGRALERGLASLTAHDMRRWGVGRHRSVDDTPYGGGAGMVLRPEPIYGALNDLRLVLGTRLGVTEDLDEEEMLSGPEAHAFALYAFLGWLEEQAVRALGG